MRKILNLFLWVCFLAASSLSLAEGTHGSSTPSKEASGRADFKFENIGKFQNESIEHDPISTEAWNFIAPNEHYNYQYEACLPKEGGAFISVGTFRGMNVASSGKVSHLVMMDIDPTALQFNKINVQLIQKAKDRAEYLSLLFTGKPQAELEENYKSGKLSGHEFIKALAQKTPSDLLKIWKGETGLTISDSDLAEFEKNIGNSKVSYSSVKDFFNTEMAEKLAMFSEFGIEDKAFFGTDDRFSHLKNMINEGKVTITPGNIASGKTFESLKNIFNKKDIKVAGVDISNIPGYLEPAQKEQVWKNIQALPFRENGRVFYTTGNNNSSAKKKSERDWWAYYAIHQRNGVGQKDFPTYYDHIGYKVIPEFSKLDGSGKTPLRLDPTMEGLDHQVLYTPTDAPCK